MFSLFNLFVIIFIFFVSYSAWKSKSLNLSGSIGAVVVGLSIYIGFSWEGLVILGCFFGSSSYVSKYKAKLKSSILNIIEKGEQRDIFQVAANGGVAALMGISTLLFPSYHEVFLIGFCVSLASATSDTWASEVGTLSSRDPRMLFTLRRVPKGTSGAISSLGTFAGLIGAIFISIFSVLLFSMSAYLIFFITCMGFLGNIFDTILGQTIQNKYYCPLCKKITEKQIHCFTKGEKINKYSFLNNDSVNFLSIAFTTIFAILISLYI
ncbi:DUF92 domain-containing protein [Metabacillus litoralis]|uniref:DUF92 domain-containing protein n=1 Tax=Metabacillus litoralis TaxID=152268 RepID=UPI001CFD1DD4|nr:DUF92 domain-containing protein [Metabacillus litoralis]